MPNSNCNVIILIFVVILIAGLVYYFCKCNSNKNQIDAMTTVRNQSDQSNQLLNQSLIQSPNQLANLAVNQRINQQNASMNNQQKSFRFVPASILNSINNTNSASDSDNILLSDMQYSDVGANYNDNNNNCNFVHNKKAYVRKSRKDIEDLYDVDQMLPQEIENDWFDTAPLQTTKKIKNSHLIDPKTQFGHNSQGSSLKNPSLDLRGDIYVEKRDVGPWMNSTTDPDTNIRGLC